MRSRQAHTARQHDAVSMVLFNDVAAASVVRRPVLLEAHGAGSRHWHTALQHFDDRRQVCSCEIFRDEPWRREHNLLSDRRLNSIRRALAS